MRGGTRWCGADASRCEVVRDGCKVVWVSAGECEVVGVSARWCEMVRGGARWWCEGGGARCHGTFSGILLGQSLAHCHGCGSSEYVVYSEVGSSDQREQWLEVPCSGIPISEHKRALSTR